MAKSAAGATQDGQVFSVHTPLGPDRLLLRELSGEESLSGLFRLVLEMDSEDPSLSFDDLVGLGVAVEVQLADASSRYLHGVVSRFLQLGQDTRTTRYRAELRPWPWLLGQHVDCRIFQHLSVPQILETVFGELGFPDYRFELSDSYAARDYCVQYNESTLAFMSRLLEEEGIFYYFEHHEQRHVLVMADDLAAFKPCPGANAVRYGGRQGPSGQALWRRQNELTSCTLEQAVVPGAMAVDDYNFQTPSTELMVEVSGALGRDGGKRRLYEYPGRFAERARGEELSNLRLEEREHDSRRLLGSGYCRAFSPGYRFTLEDHYRREANAAYVIRRVSHRASDQGYENHFEAFPADLPFRPPRRSPKPVIAGTQTAQVVGKAGEEIWTDEFGRVKVQFHWDQRGQRNEHSSCWVRVAHGWAGKGWGWFTLPRMGQEVVVSFLEGDPDRPLITGSVYNAEQTVPYGLPANQTRSTWKSDSSKGHDGNNEIRFEDKKGEEEIYLHAEKDHNLVIDNDRSKRVLNDESNTITRHRDTTIETGNETHTVAMGDRERTVAQGHDRLTVGQGDLTVTVATGKALLTVKDNRVVTVLSGDYELSTASQSVKVTAAQKVEVTALMEILLTVGPSSIKIHPGGVEILAPKISLN